MLQHTLTEENSAEINIENSSNLIINTIYNLYLCFTSKMIYFNIKYYYSNHIFVGFIMPINLKKSLIC